MLKVMRWRKFESRWRLLRFFFSNLFLKNKEKGKGKKKGI
jgi:hypothetical protein